MVGNIAHIANKHASMKEEERSVSAYTSRAENPPKTKDLN